MTGKGTEEQVKDEGVKPEGGAPPPAAKTPPTPKAEAKEEPKTASSAAGTSGEAPKRVRLSDDLDELPEAELFEMSSKDLKKRLDRHTTKELKAKFGTADFGEIKKKLDRLQELEGKEEERARAEMSERERLETDLKKERTLRTDAERRARRVQEDRVVEKEEGRIVKLAEKYIDGDYIEDVLPKLAKHLKGEYTEEQLKNLKDSAIEKWFKEYVATKPKLAREAVAAGGEPPKDDPKDAKPPPTKVPLNNGAKADRPPPAGISGKSATTNYSPSGPNAMSPQEARAAAAKEGLRW